MQLTFDVTKQHIERTDKEEPVAGSKNYLNAKFTFIGDEWTGTKTAIFKKGNDVKCVILADDDTCTVPWEVIRPSLFLVSVFCGDLVTANQATVNVDATGYAEGKTPKPPTPDEYAQLTTLSRQAVEKAQSVLDAANAGNFNGVTPHIGDNGNWYIGDTDTGISAGGGGGADSSGLSLYYDFSNTIAGNGDGTVYLFTSNPSYMGTYSIMWGDANGIMSNYTAINTMTLTVDFAVKLSYDKFISTNAIPKYATRILAIKDNQIKASFTIPTSKLFSAGNYGEHLYSWGLLSDVHVQDDTGASDFQTALTYLNNRESVDFTCISGDLTADGTATQLASYRTIRDTYSPNIPVYACTGNHEGRNATIASIFATYNNGDGMYFTKILNNDVFIFVGVHKSASGVLFTADELTWLANQLETYRNQRVFLFEHVFAENTVGNAAGIYDYDIWGGTEATTFLNLMEHYKNVIWFSGHSHLKLYLQEISDTANYYRSATNGARMIHVPGCAVPRDGTIEGTASRLECYAKSEGYVADVYANCIILRGREFAEDKFIGIAQYLIDTTTVEIESATPVLSSISTTKTTTDYLVGDTLSISDVVVMATYSDGSTKTITDWTSNVDSIDMSTAGTKTLTISYTEDGVTKTCTITITVTNPAATLSSISATKTKTSYNTGETIDTSDVVVTATYSDNTTGTVTDWTTNIASIDMTTAGDKTLTVTYALNGVTKTADITLSVSAPETTSENVLFTMPDVNNHSFTAISQTAYNKTSIPITIPSGTKVYAKWDSMTYSGANATTEKVGVVMSFNHDSTVVGTVADYQDYSNEVELKDVTSLADIASADINKMILRVKTSSSSTASFPVTMSITNFRIYTKA